MQDMYCYHYMNCLDNHSYEVSYDNMYLALIMNIT